MRRRWGSLPELEVHGRNAKLVDISTHSNLSSSSRSCMKVRSLDESLSLSYSETKKLTSSVSAPTIEEDDNDGVSFCNVNIREYNIAVGDNPSCTYGVPITMGWDYNQTSIPLDDYESEKPSGERRTQKQMLLPSSVRETRLKEAGCARREMAAAVRASNRTKSKRAQTVSNMATTYRVEQGLESGIRKLKRAIFRRKKESQEWEEWKADYQKKLALQESRFLDDESPVVHTTVDKHKPVVNVNNSKRIVIEEEDVPIVVEFCECGTENSSSVGESHLETALSTDDFEDTSKGDDTKSEDRNSASISSIDSSIDEDKHEPSTSTSTAITTNEVKDTIPTNTANSGDDNTASSKDKESTSDSNDASNKNDPLCPTEAPCSDASAPVHGAIAEKIIRKSTIISTVVDTLSDEKKDDNDTRTTTTTVKVNSKTEEECKTQ